jgi:hypothetical protein
MWVNAGAVRSRFAAHTSEQVNLVSNQEEPMLAPNPQVEVYVEGKKGGTPGSSTFLEKFVFAGLLTIGYALLCAAFVYPVVMYIWW